MTKDWSACVVCGKPRIGILHRRCQEHEFEKWRSRCRLCHRDDGKSHDDPIGPYVSPLRQGEIIEAMDGSCDQVVITTCPLCAGIGCTDCMGTGR